MQYAKAYAALIGSIATALLGVYAADTKVGQVLTVVSVVATAVATFAVPNAPAPNERGDVSTGFGATVVVILLAIALVLWILSMLGVHIRVG